MSNFKRSKCCSVLLEKVQYYEFNIQITRYYFHRFTRKKLERCPFILDRLIHKNIVGYVKIPDRLCTKE